MSFPKCINEVGSLNYHKTIVFIAMNNFISSFEIDSMNLI